LGALPLLIALLLLAPSSAVASCEGDDETGPLITEAKLTPGTLPSTGGTGVISARVADECAVQQVYVEVSSTEGTYVSFELLPVEDINTNARFYRGAFQIPTNFQEWPVGYQATIYAEGVDGYFSEAYAGEIEVAGLAPFDEAPELYAPSVTPSLWGGLGGESRIRVSAYDTRGLGNVYAIVTYPNSKEFEFPMEPLQPPRFEGTLKVPGNNTTNPRSYAVAVFAEDDIGQTTGIYAGSVTVEPKGVPNPGFIAVEPGFLRFGAVTLGQLAAYHTVTVRNTGKPGSPTVSGLLRSTDPQFFMLGAGTDGLPISLEPGEEAVVDVGFQPGTKGQQSARLSVVRDDGRQTNTGVSLFGWGVK
jgi:hypothetical protein